MVVDVSTARPLVFNHIPKTAGVAVTIALETAVDPTAPFTGFDRFLLGNNMDRLSAVARRGLLATPADLPEADLVYGHISPVTTRERFAARTELTILREPKSRLVSHWLFFRTFPDYALRGWGNWADDVKASRVPLPEFLQNPRLAYYTDNLITRFLIGSHDRTPVGAFIRPEDDEEVLAAAVRSLEAFDFVDVLENPGLARGLSRCLERPVAIGRANETQQMPPTRRCDIAAETAAAADLLEQRTRLDAALWDRVAARTYLAPDSVAAARQEIFAAARERYTRQAAAKGPGLAKRTTVSAYLRLRTRAGSVKHYLRSKSATGVYGR
jgi:hypothetical protein